LCEQCLIDFENAYLRRAVSKLKGGRGRGMIRKRVLVLAVIKNHFLDVWFTSKDVDEVLSSIGIGNKSYAVLSDLGVSKILDSSKIHTKTNEKYYKLYCVNEVTYQLLDKLWGFDFKKRGKIRGYTENAKRIVEEARKAEQSLELYRKMRNYAIVKVKNGEKVEASDLVSKFNVRPVDAGRVLAWVLAGAVE